MLLALFGLVGELAERDLGSGAVDLPCRVLRHRAERRVLGDAISVAVGGDGAGVPGRVVSVAHEESEDAAGVHGLELGEVAHE